MCDDNGTTADYNSDGEYTPAPCQWCDERKQIIKDFDVTFGSQLL